MAPWTPARVAERFHEAAVTAHRLPPVRLAGYARYWPEVVRQRWEAYSDERIVLRFAATAQAVDRMLEAIDWLRWLDESQRTLVWARAQQRPWKSVCAQLGCTRATAWRRWQHALALIVVHLNGAPPRIRVAS